MTAGDLLNPPGSRCGCGQPSCARKASYATDVDLVRVRTDAHAAYRLGTPWHRRGGAGRPTIPEAAAATETWATGVGHVVVASGKTMAAAINALTSLTIPVPAHMRRTD